jgi:hypothetical protein
MAKEGERARFVCDAMLGRLCKWLRLVGYDCRYADVSDDELVALAGAEKRVVLTRDTSLVRRRDLGAHLFIRHDHVQDQMKQVAEVFGIDLEARAGTRCLRCNVALEGLAREAAAGRVPPYVWRTQENFWRCPSCARVYWPGTHWEHMTAALRGLAGAAASARTEGQGLRTESQPESSVLSPQSSSLGGGGCD